MPVGVVEGQQTAHLTVTLTGQSLTAGFNNNVTVSIQNNFYSAIYDVGVAVSVPAPLGLLGDNLWHQDRMEMGQGMELNFQVYAPTSATGSSYVGTLVLTYKQLGDVSYTTETHALGMSVHGWISLVLYGLQMTPSATTPGGNATVSGNILNNGNLAGYNANVSVTSEVQASGSASVYIGEIDPNIPRPFSVLVLFKSSLAPGNYSVVVRASAIDNGKASAPYIVQQSTLIQIRQPARQFTGQGQRPTGLIAVLFEILSYLYGVFFGSSNIAAPSIFVSNVQTATLVIPLAREA
jgi:hypothetical protein